LEKVVNVYTGVLRRSSSALAKSQAVVIVVVIVIAIIAFAGYLFTRSSSSSPYKKLTVWMLTEVPPYTPNIPEQWAAQFDSANPGVNVSFQFIDYGDYFTKITAAITSHTLPDILYIYDAWLPTLVGAGTLSAPPTWVQNDVKANFTTDSTLGVTYNDTVWGYPTETDDYMLLYNKMLFSQADISAPPTTWAQLVQDAVKLTHVGPNGQITQEGFDVITGWDNGVVHPWLAMLRSDGGHMFYPNGSAALTSPQAMQVAQFYYNLTHVWNVTTTSLPWDTTFITQHAAMIVMADWWEGTLESEMGSNFTNVGVAPIPVGPMGTSSLTVSYNWLWVVTSTSKNQQLAWQFLKFIDSPNPSTHVSPMGTWLMGLGIIPSRTSDIQNNATFTSDPFMKPFIAFIQSGDAPSVPIIANYEQVITLIQHTIESIESGSLQPAQGMDLANAEVDQIMGV
jgi:multiple sugar transport system substrate-binding protein